MVLVDTSVWIDLFGHSKKHRVSPDELMEIMICPPILQEVLQGIKDDPSLFQQIRESLLALPIVERDPSLELYLEAAELYRRGRKKGRTIRSSVDCLIAAIAMKHDLPVWHDDRDFEEIAGFTHLRTFQGASFFTPR